MKFTILNSRTLRLALYKQIIDDTQDLA